MADFIKDGTGSGYLAKVTTDNKLSVYSKSASLQHSVSEEREQAYQVISTATLGAGETVVMHVTNQSSSNMVVTYLRHQLVGASGGTSFPNASNYFSVRLGRRYASGGSAVTPVNVFSGSGNTPNVDFYGSGPTLSGTALEIDRWYTKSDGDMNTFNKEGALIIPQNQTMEIAYQGDQTGGTIYSRLSFIMED